jgi:hypothetical protein
VSQSPLAAKKPENPWASIVLNVVLPALVLTKLSGEANLGPKLALLVALSFPIAYSVWDFWVRRSFSFIAGIGILGVLSKGGMGLMQLNHFWFAVNEAAVPTIIALALWVSMRVGRPLVNTFLMNESVMNVSAIAAAIDTRGQRSEYDQLIRQSTYLLILSFIVSAVLNFFLAWLLLKSPVGSEKFNEEMGYMTAVSMPVILLCSTSILGFALWRMIKRLESLTGMDTESLFAKKPGHT